MAIYYIYRKHISSVLQLRQLTPRAALAAMEGKHDRVRSGQRGKRGREPERSVRQGDCMKTIKIPNRLHKMYPKRILDKLFHN